MMNCVYYNTCVCTYRNPHTRQLWNNVMRAHLLAPHPLQHLPPMVIISYFNTNILLYYYSRYANTSPLKSTIPSSFPYPSKLYSSFTLWPNSYIGSWYTTINRRLEHGPTTGMNGDTHTCRCNN